MNLIENWLYARARSTPRKKAIIYEEKTLTFQELFNQVSSAASWLSAHNVGKKTKVGIILPNIPEFIILLHALIQTESVAVLINLRLTTKEIKKQLHFVDVDAIIFSADFYDKVKNIGIKTLYSVDELYGVPQIDFFSDVDPISSTTDMRQTHCIVFTSGSTGDPKAVQLSYKNHYYSAVGSAFRLGVLASDIWLLTIPLYHLGGLAIVFRSCLYGISIHLCRDFDEKIVSKQLFDGEISLISLVPTMLRRLLPYLTSKPKTLRVILLGGAATPVSLISKSQQIDLPLATTYGMTETSSQVATALPNLVKIKPKTVGKPLLFVDIKIFDQNKDGIGEIGIKGPMVMIQYYGNTQTDSQDYRDGYFLTGDFGYLDSEGDLYVLQRRTDLIISGGENIYPAEIEKALNDIEGIEDACVVPLEREKWGQEPVAILITSKNLNKDLIIAKLRKNLANYKVPRKYFRIGNFPKTSSGKIVRQELIDKLISKQLESLD